MIENYAVIIEPFAERHYIKNFGKKYHRAWDITLKALTSQFERIDMLLQKDVADVIVDVGDLKIVKTDFSVAGTHQSPKGSGNRCIVAINESCKKVHVLLVYHKNDLGAGNETVKWKQIIKDNYSQYAHLF
jgi:hypothetical protein